MSYGHKGQFRRVLAGDGGAAGLEFLFPSALLLGVMVFTAEYGQTLLGIVGGDFVPEAKVAVREQSYAFLTLMLSDTIVALSERDEIVFAGASSSAFGEHMRAGG